MPKITKPFSLVGKEAISRSRAKRRFVMPRSKEVAHAPPRSRNGCEFQCVALLLQGGGALGAYQGGVYEALAEADIAPDWIAGISIGAINAAIIAGNPPNSRADRLREFWTQVTLNAPWHWS